MGKFSHGDRVQISPKAKAAPDGTHGKKGAVVDFWDRLPEREYTVYIVQLDGDGIKVEIEEYDLTPL